MENAKLGYSVNAYNRTVVVGSPRARSSGEHEFLFVTLHCITISLMLLPPAAIYAGAAYIYNFNYHTGNFNFVQKITTPASTTEDAVGISTSIRGEWIVLGSPFNSQFGNSTGHAYFYKRGDGDDGGEDSKQDSDTFSQLASISHPSYTVNSNFGWSVSVNRFGTVAVGAPGSGGNGVGSVFIYKTLTFAQWTLVGRLEPTDITSSFGWVVAINDE